MNDIIKLLILYLLLLKLILALTSCSIDAKGILNGLNEKCQSIENGYYEMDKYWKLMSRDDTIQVTHRSYFKKVEEDPILSFVFHSHFSSLTPGLERNMNLIYTGNELVVYTDSIGGIYSHPRLIWDIAEKNLIFSSYLPITYIDKRPIPNKTMLESDNVTVFFVNEEQVNSIQCYHIKVVVPAEYDFTVLKDYISSTEYNYWINKQDSIPIQFTIHRNLKVRNDTLVTFEKYILRKYELNILNEDSLFHLHAIPPHISLQNVEPNDKKELLQTGMIAPNWSLASITGETITLNDFRGNLVFMDFFYTSCPPCIEILPELQTLQNKYKNCGFHIIGVSAIDTQEILERFCVKHNIDYTMLLGNEDINDNYNISRFPTTYLISKEGKILFQHIGSYDNVTFKNLENIIQQHVE